MGIVDGVNNTLKTLQEISKRKSERDRKGERLKCIEQFIVEILISTLKLPTYALPLLSNNFLLALTLNERTNILGHTYHIDEHIHKNYLFIRHKCQCHILIRFVLFSFNMIYNI